jgi:CRISPR-associated protein Cmr1
MRKQHKEIPAVEPQSQPQVITQEREYKLITPLFGGGAITGECDEVTIVRGTEVRGQLRFWWRACYGGRYKTVEEMKEAEDRIWGAAMESKQNEKDRENVEVGKLEKTTVQIMVEALNLKSIENQPPYEVVGKEGERKVRSRYNIPGYAAFPFRPPQEEVNKPVIPLVKPVSDNVSFLLTISFPAEVQKDVEGALWAWETFGGIGARTRRGFGALYLEKSLSIKKTGNIEEKEEIIGILPHADEAEVKTWILSKFAEFGIAKKAQINIPCLSREMHFEVIFFHKNARMTWNLLIDALSNFRQKRSGSQQRKGNFGRSQWPEAEAIRVITGKRDWDKYDPLPHPQKFPRAAFGLPINFHFKDKRDPGDVTLQGSKKGHDRFASPLILRPLCCSHSEVVGLAVVLENSALPDEKLVLRETKSGKEYPPVSAKLKSNEIQDVSPLNGEADILQAFMNYLKSSSQGSSSNNNQQRGK